MREYARRLATTLLGTTQTVFQNIHGTRHFGGGRAIGRDNKRQQLIYQFRPKTDWLSMSRHNGIDANRKQYKTQRHGSHMPLSAEHGAASATVQFDAVLQTIRTGSMRSWSVFCARRRIKEQRNHVSILPRIRTDRKPNLIYAFRSFIVDKVCAKHH